MDGEPLREGDERVLLDAVLAEDSVEAGLTRGARALAALAGAEVAALLVIEGGECVLQAWAPDQPALRERHFAGFRRAAEQACGIAVADADASGEDLVRVPLAL